MEEVEIPEGLESLTEKVKRYSTIDEFLRIELPKEIKKLESPNIIYRAIDSAIDYAELGKGLYGAKNPAIAKLFGDNIEKIIINPIAKIIKEGSPEFESLMRASGGNPELTRSVALARGIDGIKGIDPDTGTVIFNEKVINSRELIGDVYTKIKSQLIDFYNLAKKERKYMNAREIRLQYGDNSPYELNWGALTKKMPPNYDNLVLPEIERVAERIGNVAKNKLYNYLIYYYDKGLKEGIIDSLFVWSEGETKVFAYKIRDDSIRIELVPEGTDIKKIFNEDFKITSDEIIVIVSDDCPICQKLPRDDDTTYIDVNSPEAEKYGVDEVPAVFVNGKRCKLMEDSETGEIFINCPEEE